MREEASLFFEYLFENAKSGSIFLFVDNSSGRSHQWFGNLVAKHNRLRVNDRLIFWKQVDKVTFQVDNSEWVADLEPYYSKFSQFDEYPRLRSYIAYRICYKM